MWLESASGLTNATPCRAIVERQTSGIAKGLLARDVGDCHRVDLVPYLKGYRTRGFDLGSATTLLRSLDQRSDEKR